MDVASVQKQLEITLEIAVEIAIILTVINYIFILAILIYKYKRYHKKSYFCVTGK